MDGSRKVPPRGSFIIDAAALRRIRKGKKLEENEEAEQVSPVPSLHGKEDTAERG